MGFQHNIIQWLDLYNIEIQGIPHGVAKQARP